VTAVPAEVFIVVAAPFGEIEEVAGKQTDRRMFDFFAPGLFLQKGMTTIAGVLVKSLPVRHNMNCVPKQIAQITDLLCESGVMRERVALDSEEQRMSAQNASVLVMAGSHGYPDVSVAKHKARHRVRYPRFLARVEIVHAAAAGLFQASHRFESHITDFVAEQQTR
jgi:hypothetical protein